MTLGQNIYRLRKEKNLSQGDLADMLEVSRQSVSKWETDASVPDIDKLVKLSELFGVTIDVLIKGAEEGPGSGVRLDAPSRPAEEGGRSGRKTAAVILLCFAAFAFILVTALGDIFAGLLMAVPFAVCGVICLIARKYPGLWCAWAVFFMAEAVFTFATGAGRNMFIMLLRYGMTFDLHGVISLIRTLVGIALAFITVWIFRRNEYGSIKKNYAILGICGGTVVLINAVDLTLAKILSMAEGGSFNDIIGISVLRYRFSFICEWITTVAIIIFIIRLIWLIRQKRRTEE